MQAKLAVLILPLFLGGCPSLWNSGYTEVTYTGPLCTDTPVTLTVKTGKEYGQIAGGCSIDPVTHTAMANFSVVDAKAFEGQALSAGVANGIVNGFKDLAKAGLAVALPVPKPL